MTARSQLRHKQALALVVIVAGLAPTGVVAGSRYARSTPGKLKADIGAHSHGRGATAMGSVRDQVEPDGISKARGCTMAVPPARATVEATIANASDFCELVSHALATNVFRSPVLVTPGVLWHYAGTTMSCRLRYAHTRQWMTIHNSSAACRWLRRLAPEWRVETLADCPDRARGMTAPSVNVKTEPAQPIAVALQHGLYAFNVVPRAPNFCALRRVSSNLERA